MIRPYLALYIQTVEIQSFDIDLSCGHNHH